MKRLFKVGARYSNPAARWRGRCEVDISTLTYIYYPDWPVRNDASRPVLITMKHLDDLLSTKAWAEDYNPDLVLQEGL